MSEDEFIELVDVCLSGAAAEEQRIALALELQADAGRRQIYYEQAATDSALAALSDAHSAGRLRASVVASLGGAQPGPMAVRVIQELRTSEETQGARNRAGAHRSAESRSSQRKGTVRSVAPASRPQTRRGVSLRTFAITALAFLATAGAWAWLSFQAPEGLVSAATYGKVSIERGSRHFLARPGSVFHSGDTINTEPGAHALLVIQNEGISVEAEGGSEIHTKLTRQDLALSLAHGSIVAKVDHREKRVPFRVQTSSGSASIVGTRFRISATGGVSRLEVTEGDVAFTKRDTGVMIHVKESEAAVASAGAPDESFEAVTMEPLPPATWQFRTSEQPGAEPLSFVSALPWTSAEKQSPGSWIELDLGTRKTLSKVLCKSDAAQFPRSFLVSGSSDRLHWTKLGSTAGSAVPAELIFPPTVCRYLRFELDSPVDTKWTVTDISVFR